MAELKKQTDMAAAKLFLTIMAVNLGNYLLNLIIGRWLGPEQFAEVGILSTMVLVLSFFSLGIQITTTKFTAQLVEKGISPFQFFKQNLKQGLWIGFFLMVVLVIGAKQIQSFFHFENVYPILIIAIGIPFYFVMSIQRGFLQGKQDVTKFSNSYIVEMVTRLLCTILLVFVLQYFELAYITSAIAIAFLLSFIAGCLYSTVEIDRTALFNKNSFELDNHVVLKFLGIVLCYELVQVMISYSDSLLVKHFYDDQVSGLYTALSLIGRMVYFATWAFVMLLIPKVVAKKEKGEAHEILFIRYFLIIAGLGGVATLISLIMPKFIVTVLFGSAYLSIVPLVWKYALASTLFACANLFAYYHISIESYKPVIITGLVGLLQIILIFNFHQSITTIIHIQIALMSALLLTLLIYHFIIRTEHETYKNSNRIAFSTK